MSQNTKIQRGKKDIWLIQVRKEEAMGTDGIAWGPFISPNKNATVAGTEKPP